MTAAADAAGERPNIIYILADDLGYADCGFTGCREIPTPHLDRLAARGAVLDAFYVQPLCSPTRAALMTGRYPMRYGLQVGVIKPKYHFGLPLEERTLPQALREVGYATAICGKWHLGSFDPTYWPNARGFDYAYGHLLGMLDYFTRLRDGHVDWYRNGERLEENGYTTEMIAREAVRYIRERDADQPFFLYVPFNAVHLPLQAPEKYLARFRHMSGQRAIYAAMLSCMDDAVGEIVAAVEDKGLGDRTLVVFSSDNGGASPGKISDNGPFRAGKATLYEGGVRACAFATWGGHIPAGIHIQEPLHLVDWYPTLLRLAGASLAPDKQKLPLDGRDLWPTLTEGRPSPHEEILLNAAPDSGALRAGDWKLKLKRNKRGHWQVELFNLAEDPGERNNLAHSHPEKVQELRARYDRLAAQAARPLVETEPEP